MNIKLIIENTLVPHTAFLNASRQLEQCFQYAENALEPIGLPLVGESRTGKSRCLESFMLAHRNSRSAEGNNIPIFSVKAPPKPTVKGLVENMLLAIGDPKFDKGTEQVKTNRLLLLMQRCKTRMFIIDEFQHFVDKGSSKIAFHVADWLKMVLDQSRVSVVVAGLPICLDVLRGNEQLAGRFMAPVFLPRFDWLNDDLREEFQAILTTFHEEIAKHFDTPDFSTDEMAFRFHCASGGLIGYLAKILRTAIWMAVDQDRKSISLDDLNIALVMSVDKEFFKSPDLRPFTKDFSTNPTTVYLEHFAKIGTRVEQAVSGRRLNRSNGGDSQKADA